MPKTSNDYLNQLRKLPPIERLAHWITRREQARLNKDAGYPKPWTDDPILQQYRFCNVRRMDDKVSVWLLDNWYRPFHNHPLMVPAVALARFVNLPSSLEKVTGIIFQSDYWKRDEIAAILRDHRDAGNTLFNGAYMVRGNDGVDKVSSVLDHYIESLRDAERGPEKWLLPDTSSMEVTCGLISARYGFGSFMAGQVVADLRWAVEGTWEDKNGWAPRGPGSQRGLNRVLGLPLKRTWKGEEFVTDLLNVRYMLRPFLTKQLRSKLELHDYQNTLCEFDKYERVVWEEKTRPKQKYSGA